MHPRIPPVVGSTDSIFGKPKMACANSKRDVADTASTLHSCENGSPSEDPRHSVSFPAKIVFERLDMLANGSGLFRVDAKKRSPREVEQLAAHAWRARLETFLEDAREHGADWVYFRLECETGGPKSEIFIYDRSQTLSGGHLLDVAKLHHELWNYGKVPLAFILRPAGVEIFNLLVPPEFGSNGILVDPKPLETLRLSPADTLAVVGAATKGVETIEDEKWRRFSGARFDNGSFWEVLENREIGSNERSSVATMVDEMRVVRRELENHFAKHHKLPADLAQYEKSFIHRLLILTLMVRFMEERGIIPPDYFKDKEHADATDFKSLLRYRTPLLRAFDRLARDFNGDIFTLADSTDDGETPMHRILRELPEPEIALGLIADFADGKMHGRERYFWNRYSFKHLPVEAISYVYEDFLGNRSQSYFTPHHLVDLMLDEVMPSEKVVEALRINDPRKEDSVPAYPVLDPSCGSGVFLVGAWHRLVEALRQIDPNPSPETLRRLMLQNIHGVDVERDSVELTIFSLCVALCSEFPYNPGDPNFTFNKLRELKFPNLRTEAGQRRNIHCRDFFTERSALVKSSLRFQLIVGNPPFESKLEREVELAFDKFSPDEEGKVWPRVPDTNISYLFLRSVPPLLKRGGVVCLVQNAGLLYNDKPKGFRKALFDNWHVTEVLDFASINGLFKKRLPTKDGLDERQAASRVKVAVIVIEHREPDPARLVLHATFRRTPLLDERGTFEIDPQDLHRVPRKVAGDDPRLWIANLLGGGRLLETYNSLTDCETLKKHLANLSKHRGWSYSEGFIEGTPSKEQVDRKEWIHRKNWKLLPTESFEGDSIPHEDSLLPSGIENFERPRDDLLFTPPHLLIKENEGFPMVLRLSGANILFRDKVVGIAAPDTDVDREKLRCVHNYLLQNRRATEFFTAFGPQYLIFRVGVPLKKSLDDLPYPKEGNVLFNGIQTYLRDDVLDFMIPFVKDTKRMQADLAKDADETEVIEFMRVFVEVMRSAFPNLRCANKPHDLGSAWCVTFYREESSKLEFGESAELRKYIDALLLKKMGRSLRCWRIVRQFHGKNLYLVKPKPRRYWLRSAAVRDADEMFSLWASQTISAGRNS